MSDQEDGRRVAFIDELARWRSARSQRLTAEWGWLSLVARFVLSPGDNEIDIGSARFVDGEVAVSLAPGVVALDEQGRPITAHRWPAGSTGGEPYFFVGAGLTFFPPDRRFDVVARLERVGAPATLTLGQGLGGAVDHVCPGALVFTLDGREHRLLPVIDADAPDKYFLLFRDRTSGRESYGAGRFLYLDPADADGRVHLDFNRAFNPPCALTPYAACPVVPPQNHLPIAITAGELAPAAAH